VSTIDTIELLVNSTLYYGASIDGIPTEQRPDLYGWVVAQLGRGRGDLTTAPIWFAHEDFFWFRYEEDRTLFILRWS
jgi:hypothetical protein